MSNRGLLNIANKFKLTEDNNEPHSHNVSGKALSAPIGQNSNGGIIQSEESCINITSKEPLPHVKQESKDTLVSYTKWRIEVGGNSLKKEKASYEYELIPFASWRHQTDEKYDAIKKATQAVLPAVVDEVEYESPLEEVLEEDLLELSPVEDLEESKSVYTIDDFADLLQEDSKKVEARTENIIARKEDKLIESIEDDTKYNHAIAKAESVDAVTVKNKRKSFVTDIFTILFCLIGCAVSLYAFYLSFNRSFSQLNEEPIAVITFKYKSAQRKLSDRVLWDRVKQNTPIYNGDIIRTANFSEATITFYDGNIINLYDQSLAQIFYNEDGAAVDFTGGEISIEATEEGSGIRLSSGESTVNLTAGSSLMASIQMQIIDGELQAIPAAPIELQIMTGKAVFSSVGTEMGRVLEENIGVIVEQDGSVVHEQSLSVFSPRVNAKYLRKENTTFPVVFNWAASSGDGVSYTFELSRKKDFSEITEQIDVSGIRTITRNLTDGMWYWRIYTGSPEKGKSGKFRVMSSPLTETIVPSEGELYRYTLQTPSLRFLWVDDVYAKDWLLEVSDNAEMINPDVSKIVTQSSAIITNLDEGIWYWRVTPSYPNTIIYEDMAKVHSSNVASFVVSQNAEQEEIVLTYPRERAFVDSTSDRHFSWVHSNEAEFYTLMISKRNDMTSFEVKQSLEENYYIISSEDSSLSTGHWYWTVTQTDEAGTVSPVGEIRSFFVIEGDPTQKAISPGNGEIILENDIHKTLFMWENNIPYRTSIQISSDELFQTVVFEKETLSNSLGEISLPAGKWYWRIISRDDTNGVVYSSEANQFFVEYSLDSVVLIEPRKNETVVVDPSRPLVFSWDTVLNADHYELKLFKSSDLETAIYENLRVEGRTLSVDMHVLPKTSYIISLSAVIENSVSGTIQKSIVTEHPFITRTVEPNRLNSPSNDSSINGITALVDPVSVRWTSVEKVVSSEFILANSDKGLSASARRAGVYPSDSEIVLRINNPNTTLRLPPLTEGTWYWTVVGTTDNGFDITPPTPSRFVVEPIENLPGVIAKTPQQDEVFDLEYLSDKSYIDFSWSAVDNADSYLFILQNADKEVIIEKVFTDVQSFRFEDLALLDRGTFTWSVEAARNLPNGIIQHGNISSYSFVIDLPEIMTAQDKTQGDLYGL